MDKSANKKKAFDTMKNNDEKTKFQDIFLRQNHRNFLKYNSKVRILRLNDRIFLLNSKYMYF